MASVTMFLILAIVVGVLILAASILATIAAANVSRAVAYSNSAFTARQHLTIAAAVGWSGLAVLIVILLIMWATGGFKPTQIKIGDTIIDANSTSDEWTKQDLLKAYGLDQRMESTEMTETIIFVILIVIGIIALVVGIEGTVGASFINGIPINGNGNVATIDTTTIISGTSLVNGAYGQAIAAAVLGYLAAIVSIGMIIAYFQLREARKRNLVQLKDMIQKGETRLAVNG